MVVILLLSHVKDNLDAFKIHRLQTSHPKALIFFSNSGICYYRKVRVSLCRQHFSFCLGEHRIYFYSSNSNFRPVMFECGSLFFDFCLACSESFCSRYLSLCMTQRSSFVLNICLWLLPHLQFLFSTLEHLTSSGFISVLCLVEPQSPSSFSSFYPFFCIW